MKVSRVEAFSSSIVRPRFHHATARKKWSKEVNIVATDRILLMRILFLLNDIGIECKGTN